VTPIILILWARFSKKIERRKENAKVETKYADGLRLSTDDKEHRHHRRADLGGRTNLSLVRRPNELDISPLIALS